MQCPKCNCIQTKVIDSRSIEKGKTTRRRRQCTQCEVRFTTFERIEITDLVIRKSDNTSELYSREKLERGIWISCGKLHITRKDIDELITSLEEKWFARKEISSREIGEDVMNALKELNEIAYIRFASVYRDFKDVEDFLSEIQKTFTKKKKI